MVGSERRRSRPVISCTLCRRRKLRCDRQVPCSNCMRSKTGHCVYESCPSAPAQRPKAVSSRASSPISQTSNQDADTLKSRIRQLEDQLLRIDPSQALSSELTSTPTVQSSTSLAAIASPNNQNTQLQGNSLFGHHEILQHSIVHKTRLFGQSHWSNGLSIFQDTLSIIEPLVRDLSSNAAPRMQQAKSLAKQIKWLRAPSWPCSPTSELPSKEVADGLIECYMRTTETVYRILHVPNFHREYETIYSSSDSPNPGFMVQLKLVLAIGSASYDQHFSYRTQAVRWMYEAQTWLSHPEFKIRLSIQALQNSLLVLIAREMAGVGEEAVWIDAGAVLRKSIFMGFHREHSSITTPQFAVEMKRRLWNTLLELSLNSSMTSGAPPLLEIIDFDTKPPSNFDDENLTTQNCTPNPETALSQTSIAIALRKTYPLRLAVAKFLNDRASQGLYEDALRLDSEVRAAYKDARRAIQACRLESPSTASTTHSDFGLNVFDLTMNRYIAALHIPFLSSALQGVATYAYSRKIVLDTSLNIWRLACQNSLPIASASPSSSLVDRAATMPKSHNGLSRIVTNGSGYLRLATVQASFLIAAEIRAQIQELDNLGPKLIRPDLTTVLKEAKTWNLQCIEVGETNIKGYVLHCLIDASIEGLMKDLESEALAKSLISAVERAEDVCIPILEAILSLEGSEGHDVNEDGLSGNLSSKDGNFLMHDSLFDFNDLDPMSWDFSDTILSETYV